MVQRAGREKKCSPCKKRRQTCNWNGVSVPEVPPLDAPSAGEFVSSSCGLYSYPTPEAKPSVTATRRNLKRLRSPEAVTPGPSTQRSSARSSKESTPGLFDNASIVKHELRRARVKRELLDSNVRVLEEKLAAMGESLTEDEELKASKGKGRR